MAKTTLNIGMVGYGFMGRPHSNAFLQAWRLVELDYKPVRNSGLARNAPRPAAFAARGGW